MKTLFTRAEFSAKLRTWLVDLEEFDAARDVLENEIGFLIVDVPTDEDENDNETAGAAAADGNVDDEHA